MASTTMISHMTILKYMMKEEEQSELTEVTLMSRDTVNEKRFGKLQKLQRFL